MKKNEVNNLIAGALTGDQRSIEKLVIGSRTTILQQARSYNYSYDEREEIVEEVCLKVLKSLKTFDPKKSCYDAWLRRIAKNHCIDVKRKKDRRKENSLDENLEFVEYDNETLYEALDDSADARNKEKVARLLNKLDGLQRKVVELRYFDEMGYREIAEELQITENNATVIHSRAMQRLRNLCIAA